MSMHSYPSVGCFKGHVRMIVSLQIHPSEPILISAAEDCSIRMWRLETFQETYRLSIMEPVLGVHMSTSHEITIQVGVEACDKN